MPEITREMSSRSSINWLWAMSVALDDLDGLRRLSSLSIPPSSIRAQPRIAVSGVRSSCDTTAINSSFARDERSATSRASCAATSSRSRSASGLPLLDMATAIELAITSSSAPIVASVRRSRENIP